MMVCQSPCRMIVPALILIFSVTLSAGDDAAPGRVEPSSDPVFRALVDELDRSMSLEIEDLQKPYFVQYFVDDRFTHRIAATCGAVVSSADNRSRILYTQVRVGSYELDNTNFSGGGGDFFGRRGGGRRGGGGGGGGATPLPLDDDYLAIRQAVWMATDSQYKSAVETFTQKQAYMKDRDFSERTPDFTVREGMVKIEPEAALPSFDRDKWAGHLRRISGRFLDYPAIRASGANLTVSAGNNTIVDSEGARIRQGKTGAALTITAEVQAANGETLSDSKAYTARTPAGLPAVDTVVADVDALVKGLCASVNASVLEDYTGPVLFDGESAPQLFNALLVRGVAGQPPSVGEGRRRFSAMENLAKYLGRRILPRSFRVFDDPTVEAFMDTVLAGHFSLDDEGVPAQRVDLVKDGKLEMLLMSRVPTKEFSLSNGHGRRSGRAGGARAAVGSLFVECGEALSREDLKQALLDEADDQGLDYALRVTSLGARTFGGGNIRRGGRMPGGFGRGSGSSGSAVGDPVYIYKVYVEDGREEPVRGCEFGSVAVSHLRKIIAAGDTPFVSNRGGSTSIIAPPVIIEELELYAIEEERLKKPFVEAPHARGE